MRREKRSDFIGSSPRLFSSGWSRRGTVSGLWNWPQTLGHDLWIGDAAKIRASDVRAQKHDRRDAELILKLLLEDDSHESGHRLVRRRIFGSC